MKPHIRYALHGWVCAPRESRLIDINEWYWGETKAVAYRLWAIDNLPWADSYWDDNDAYQFAARNGLKEPVVLNKRRVSSH